MPYPPTYPNRYQAYGTCYAEAGATVIDSIINKGSPYQLWWATSALYLAMVYANSLPSDTQKIKIEELIKENSNKFTSVNQRAYCAQASSISAITGGLFCPIFERLKANDYRLCSFYDIDGLGMSQNSNRNFFPNRKGFDYSRSWGGHVPIMFDMCRMELRTLKKNEPNSSALHYATTKNAKEIITHPAFKMINEFPDSACQYLFLNIEMAGVKWRLDNSDLQHMGFTSNGGTTLISGFDNQPITFSSCWDQDGLGCTPRDRSNLMAMVALLGGLYPNRTFEVFNAYLSATCNQIDSLARLKLNPYECKATYPNDVNQFYERIEGNLRKKRGVNVGFPMREVEKNYDPNDPGWHAMAIIGFKDFGTKRRYLVRNSWGRGCDSFRANHPRFSCNENTGDLWFDRDFILEFTDGVETLECKNFGCD